MIFRVESSVGGGGIPFLKLLMGIYDDIEGVEVRCDGEKWMIGIRVDENLLPN